MPSRDSTRLFDELYAEHHRSMHAFFLARTREPQVALDLVQELFLRLWRSQLSVEALPSERRRFWLYAVARNLVVDHQRSRQARDTATQRLEQSATPADVASAETQALEHEQLQRVDAAIARLPDDLRAALVLQVVGQRSSAEIGEILGQPPGTVRYHLAQARRRLAADLSEGARA